jgi:hypothetical protein
MADVDAETGTSGNRDEAIGQRLRATDELIRYGECA